MSSLLKTLIHVLVLGFLAAIVGWFLFDVRISWPAVGSALAGQWQGDWSFPGDAAMGLVTVVALWLTAAGWGLWLLQRTGADASLPSPWQQLVLGLLCGWLFLALGALALGMAGFCNRLALGLWVLAVAVWGTQGWTPFFRRLIRDEAAVSELNLPRWVLLGGGLIYLITLPYALTPAIQSDELRYHLAAPETWLALGRIEYLPNQAFSNFPFLVEMLFMIALALQGAEGAHMIHLAFLESSAVLIALIAWSLMRETAPRTPFRDEDGTKARRTLAGMAGVAFATIPTAAILACWGFVDIASCAYFFAMAYVGALMLTSRRPPPPWLLGVMAAGAMGTKYSMIPLAIAVAVYFAPLLAWTRGAAALRTTLLPALGIALLLVSPWLIRNVMWTGNPVYPLAYSVFGGDDWSEANAEFYASKAAEKGFSATDSRLFLNDQGEPDLTLADKFDQFGLPSAFLAGPAGEVFEFAISPLTTALFPRPFEDHYLGPLPLVAWLLGFAGLLLLLLPREPPAGTRRPQFALLLWIFGLVLGSWLFWFLTYQSNRLLLPSVGLLIAAGAWGFASLARPWRGPASLGRGPRTVSMILTLLLTLVLLHGWSFSAAMIGAAFQPHPLPRALGFGARETYIGSALNYYRGAKWLEANLAEGEKALLIGEHRTLYFPAPVIASDWFDTPQPLPLLRETETNEQLFSRLASRGVRYVFYNEQELSAYARAYFAPRFSQAEWLRFQNFLNDPRLSRAWQDPQHAIYVFRIDEPSPVGEILDTSGN